MLKMERQAGFSFLELTFVIIIVSLLLYLGVPVYLKEIKKSQLESIRFQANSFSRTINNLHATAQIGQANYIELGNIKIFINERGWPANTDERMSAKSWNQSPEECQQLWQALYEMAPESVLTESNKKATSLYLISSINGRICRYELLRKQEGIYFFDYHLDTGEVTTSFD